MIGEAVCNVTRNGAAHPVNLIAGFYCSEMPIALGAVDAMCK